MADQDATAKAAPGPTKEDIRSKILGYKGKTKIVRAYGMDIELRSPTVKQLIEATTAREGESKEDANARGSIMAIVTHCYVPGTDQKLFSEADLEELAKLPMDVEYRNLQEAISELMGIKQQVEDQVKN